MRKEYDFSNAERGKFYRPGATLNLPVYLDQEVLSYLRRRAACRGIELGKLVNDMLRQDIAQLEAAK